MSTNHHSSDQINPEPHFYWPQYLMDSSCPTKNPANNRPCRRKNQPGTAGERGGGSGKHGEGMSADEHVVMSISSGDDCRDSRSSSSCLSLDLAQNQRREIRREHLFEKPLTPSDVGKLNRLVIPKQHAEKYFPLGGGGESSGEKGFLLSFEDETGKAWRFRYSYWNSSQSYVLTKGWSRFVKEKRLDAGDFVLFSRHPADAGRHFIGWRRRHSGSGDGGGGGILYNRYTNQQVQGCSTSSPSYQPESLQYSGASPTSGNSKTLRLFGVNLECQPDYSAAATEDGGSPITGDGPRWPSPYHHQYYVVHRHHHPAVFY